MKIVVEEIQQGYLITKNDNLSDRCFCKTPLEAIRVVFNSFQISYDDIERFNRAIKAVEEKNDN